MEENYATLPTEQTARMPRERRGQKPPVPSSSELKELLTTEQLATMKTVQTLSPAWKIAFIRRPKFQEPAVVYRSMDTGNYLILDRQGNFDISYEIVIRD